MSKKKILIAAFSDFLDNDFNSAENLLKKIPSEENIIKQIILVGYFKKNFLKKIKKSQPEKIVFLGMHTERKIPMFETVSINHKITLKNGFLRFLLDGYVNLLKLFNKNLRVKKSPSKDILKLVPIEKKYHQKKLKLQTKPPKLEQIGISENAGYFVCNYSMWVVERFLREKNISSKFYFIHIPPKINKLQEEELIKFIKS